MVKKAPAFRKPKSGALSQKKVSSPPKESTPSFTPRTLTPAPGSVASRISAAYASQLVAKGSETSLYEAPNHTWYTIGSMGICFFCFTLAGYHSFFHVFNPPEGLSWWVPYMFGVTCVFLTSMGSFFFIQAGKVVAYIKAAPVSEELLKIAKSTAAKESKLVVEVGIRRPWVGFEPKRLVVAASEIKMPKKLCAPIMAVSRGELIEMERRLREQRIAEIEYDKENLMTAPFRQMGRAFMAFFTGTRRAFSMEGFATIYVAGKKYKLDILGGWALEDGKAVDRLLMAEDKSA